MIPVSPAHTALVQQLAESARRSPEAFRAMALRTRSPAVRDAIASLALPGARAGALEELGRSRHSGMSAGALADLRVDGRWLSELAALCALQVTADTPDLTAAAGLWDWAADSLGDDGLPPRDRDLRAQVDIDSFGRGDPVAAGRLSGWVGSETMLSAEVRAQLRADLANPWLADQSAGSDQMWERSAAELISASHPHGVPLAGVRVPAGAGVPFDRLTTEPLAQQAQLQDGPEIAVILTTYQPDQSLLTAVRSVIAQTWQNWTLILVDDGSSAANIRGGDLLDQAAALDPRIRVIRLPENAGTYTARNAGLRQVGDAEFVTFHDSDDWSHPQRLELSVAPLLADPAKVASIARSVRATDRLGLTHLGRRGSSGMAASLLFRTDPLLDQLGFFDPVRKSADKEYQRRIMVAHPDGLVRLPVPVAWIRRGSTSLSSADHSVSWRHHSRRHYHQCYARWHRAIRRGDADPYLDDTAPRRFWAPARWAPSAEKTEQQAQRIDVLLAGDFSSAAAQAGDAGPDVAAVVSRALREGRVGILQIDGPHLIDHAEPDTVSAVLTQIRRGHVEPVYLDDHVEVGTVIVLQPKVLHPGHDRPAAWTAARVHLATSSDPSLDRAAALNCAQQLFGAAPRWWDHGAQPWPVAALDRSDTPRLSAGELLGEDARQDPTAVAHLALRTRSEVVADALAATATSSTWSAAELAATIVSGRIPDSWLARAATPAFALATAGLAAADPRRRGSGMTIAATLYRALAEHGVLDRHDPIHHLAAAQSVLAAFGQQAATELLPLLTRLPDRARAHVLADLHHPYLPALQRPGRPGTDSSDAPAADLLRPDDPAHRRWEDLLSAPFRDAGLSGLQVRPGSTTIAGVGVLPALFDQLHAEPGPQQDGPLVTVIMPCWRPGAQLLTSLASVTAQTWANLEILLVDDASGPEYEHWFQAAAAEDPRVRVVRTSVNGGTYRARNTALEVARGEFFTVQDADDWSHPDRIERQVRALQEAPEAPMSRSRAVRATADLTHQWFGYLPTRKSAVSLLVRREVVDRIGPFGDVRKGGDSEFAERAERLLGPINEVRLPLAVYRLAPGSLSRADFSYQWSAPDRLMFRGGYRAWHQSLPAKSPARLPDSGRWPGRLPLGYHDADPAEGSREVLPWAYLADFSADPRDTGQPRSVRTLWTELNRSGSTDDESTAGEKTAGSTASSPVPGLWHLESPFTHRVRASRPEMHPRWFDLARRGWGAPITRTELLHLGDLIVLDPTVLLLARHQPVALKVNRVQLWLGEPAGPTPWPADLTEAAALCRSWWRVSPSWAIAPGTSPEAAAALRSAFPELEFTEPRTLPH